MGGQYEFMIKWPLENRYKPMHWKQSSNPTTTSHVVGYQGISIPYPQKFGNGWGGLKRAFGTHSLIDGSPYNNGLAIWYFAIGIYQFYMGGYPGPHQDAVVTQVELWLLGKKSPTPAPKSTANVKDNSYKMSC